MDKKPLFFYGWIVLAIAFVSMVVANITRNSFSVLYVVILDEFGWNRANTAGIFSANTLGFGITVPLTRALVDKFGPKRIRLFYDVVKHVIILPLFSST